MTVFTNKHNAPIEIVRSLTNDPYHKGEGVDASVTELISSPRIRYLRNEFKDKIVVDVSDQIWSLLGQSVHTILERANEHEKDVKTEERMFATVNGWYISGQYDSLSLDDKILRDYKVTSVWSVVNALKEGKKDWENQLNVLAWLYYVNYGEEINKLEIIAICRDWSKNQYMRSGGDYPPSPVATIPVNLWSTDEQLDYITERVKLHQSVQSIATITSGQKGLAPCTSEERWEKPTKYAVMKKGRKSALKLYDEKVDAELRIEYEKKQAEEKKQPVNIFYVEQRLGEPTRCVGNYCGVADFCEQYQKLNNVNN